MTPYGQLWTGGSWYQTGIERLIEIYEQVVALEYQ